MDELTLIREFDDDVPLATAAELSPIRDRVLHGTRTAPGRRFRFAGWSTAAAAAAAAVVLVLTSLGGAGSPPVADAAVLLHQAADSARAEPDVVPRPDQFVYHRSVQTMVGSRPPMPEQTYQEWRSVDGTADGAIVIDRQAGPSTVVPGCRGGRAPIGSTNGVPSTETAPCTPVLQYDPNLPTDVPGMVRYLNRPLPADQAQNWGGRSDPLVRHAMDLLCDNYLTARQKAVLFDALGTAPDLHARTGIEDLTGRAAVGISFDDATVGIEFLFDPDTHQFLGRGYVGPDAAGGSLSIAVVQVAIVDRAGQQP